jgi:hypothetical protein
MRLGSSSNELNSSRICATLETPACYKVAYYYNQSAFYLPYMSMCLNSTYRFHRSSVIIYGPRWCTCIICVIIWLLRVPCLASIPCPCSRGSCSHSTFSHHTMMFPNTQPGRLDKFTNLRTLIISLILRKCIILAAHNTSLTYSLSALGRSPAGILGNIIVRL